MGQNGSQSAVRRGVGSRERRYPTEARDIYGTRVSLDRRGLTYGASFVPFDEMQGLRPASHNLWNPATNLFEVAVVRRDGPDLVVGNLSPRTAERLRAAIVAALSGRHA